MTLFTPQGDGEIFEELQAQTDELVKQARLVSAIRGAVFIEIAKGIQKLEMSDPLRRDIERVFNKLENA